MPALNEYTALAKTGQPRFCRSGRGSPFGSRKSRKWREGARIAPDKIALAMFCYVAQVRTVKNARNA
jgi:hypothetical protein